MSAEEIDPLPPDLASLLREGRPGIEPPPGAREAVLAVVTASAVGLGAGAGVAAAGAAKGGSVAGAAVRAGSGGLWAAVKGTFGVGGLMLGAAVGVAVGAAGHAFLASPAAASAVARPVPSAEVASPAPPRSTPSVTPWEEVPPSAPTGSTASTVPAPAPSPAPTASHPDDDARGDHGSKDSSLASERALIDMARTAVARGQGDAALAALGRHERDFPHGRLAEEREWLAIQALVQTGATDEARARSVRFRRAFPRSLMLPALDQVLPPDPIHL
jgi:hypothetical protein